MWKLIYAKVSAKDWKKVRAMRKLAVKFSSVDFNQHYIVLSSQRDVS